jgi:hypothetical protein
MGVSRIFHARSRYHPRPHRGADGPASSRRALRIVGGLHALGRRGARGRPGRRRLDSCGCDGWPIRTQHHGRAGRVAGHPPVHCEATQCAPHGRRAGALPRRLRQGRGRSPARPGRARLHDPPSSDADPDPRTRQEGGGGPGSGEPAGTHRVCPASLRYSPGDDRESGIWRPGLPARDAAQDPAPAGNLRPAWTLSGDRGRWRRERDDGRTGGGGRSHGHRRRLGYFGAEDYTAAIANIRANAIVAAAQS